ncbi:MAG: hypothetical protein JNL34_10170 [Anaerolineae bacterium]|nr:hypothetical protein [Anaerolineae bacterium]
MPARARPSHRSIAAQVAQIRRARDEAPLRAAQAELAAILDGLNALGELDKLRESGLSRLLSGGPVAVQGSLPEPWVGAVIWQRAPGYFGYRTLTLYGIWALRNGEETQLRTGVRRLAYALDFFEADAYHKRIRREFALYYADDGAPPAEDAAVWNASYTPDNRLALRAEAAEAITRLIR